ncbi:hypothetical protein EKO04_000445 [Ascochyta lentis]|uniref:Heterokaryon incompatibility domain-containing protein n=1 Tax=Ascochyta lentis TaxID=205686 RepID=A0A8H7JDS3_9PLEO|nr:hypothetical protein EKO04_000445 [Ascochyta lentis]
MSGSPIYPQTLAERTIRLITVEPGGPESPVQCTLQEVHLDTAPIPYYALSYCWGAAHSLVKIICNSQPLWITPNLHSFLLEYRSRATNMPIWVDAICINQGNTSERTSQVRMMKQIYSEAKCVVVWLGEAAATDRVALELLKTINAPWATFYDKSVGKLPLFTGQDTSGHDATVAALVPDFCFDALAAFLLRPYFSRIWIVQELLSASDLIIWCGADTLNEEFPVLEASARLLQMWNCNIKTQIATTALEDKKAQGVGRLKLGCPGHLETLKFAREVGLSGILRLLFATRCFDATDPRDKIFALVGLASDVDEDFVDYSRSYEGVIKELSNMLLDGRIETESGCALDLWSSITREEEDDLMGPSWVVDWLKLKDSLYTPMMTQYPSEKPVIQRIPAIEFSGKDSTEALHVRGTIFDTVTHIVPSPVSMRQLLPQSELIAFQNVPGSYEWHAQVVDLIAPPVGTDEEAVYQPTGETLYDAFWRTLCCNRSSEDVFSPPIDDSGYIAWCRLSELQQARRECEAFCRRTISTRKRWFWSISTLSVSALAYRFRRNQFLLCAMSLTLAPLVPFFNDAWDLSLKMLLKRTHDEYTQQSTQTQIEQRDFESSFSQYTQGRKFCVTGQGLIGWLPLATKFGDSVGIFTGCRIPYVLRAFDGGYKIVGDTYLHGVMNGEKDESKGEMLRIL